LMHQKRLYKLIKGTKIYRMILLKLIFFKSKQSWKMKESFDNNT